MIVITAPTSQIGSKADMPASGSPRAARRRRRRPSGHHAQGLDVDELAAAMESKKPAGPVLAS